MTTTTERHEQDGALDWIARQLRWERTLADLRGRRAPVEAPVGRRLRPAA